MNTQILKELAEANFHLRQLRADIQRLAAALEHLAAQKGPSPATAFQKRS